MSATSTVRISPPTKEMLTVLARSRGGSLTKTADKIIRDAYMDELCRQEREATLVELRDPRFRAEMALWDETVGDGID
ncbi:MAG: hypothetical protein LBM23_07805 [Propionibacteriaceae bacterium]|jgi:hypothetical protein|nr:hypothetical protein [Propionibacteriaceae bacterium]